MEYTLEYFLSAKFLSALLAIIIIDLVLAGDNAIVIALAARNLPKKQQRQAILWGTFGAIAVRASMTIIVMHLLKIPTLMFIGGAILIWIAYRLLTQEDSGHGEVAAATSFWAAMRTIIIADAVMGLDNVLAIAGAAEGDWLLIILGLLISVPIIIWGSTLILKWLERFPQILYIGGAVLAWTSVKMMTKEPMVEEWLVGKDLLVWISYIVVIFGTLGAAWWVNKRRARRALAREVA